MIKATGAPAVPFGFDLFDSAAIIATATNLCRNLFSSARMTGRTHDLKVDKTTIGRVEDKRFKSLSLPFSSHHCEVAAGNDVAVKDLNSTNGTFINGEKINRSPAEARANPS